MAYTRLAEHERYHIYRRIQNGIPLGVIAQELGRHVSTIRREITRNKLKDGFYSPPVAQAKAKKRQLSKISYRITPDQWVMIDGS